MHNKGWIPVSSTGMTPYLTVIPPRYLLT
nr:WPE palindromic element domain-containing protein [Wolbachia endosymbiont of Cardiocondyla obscurior]